MPQHEHARGKRVQGPGVADLAGLENPLDPGRNTPVGLPPSGLSTTRMPPASSSRPTVRSASDPASKIRLSETFGAYSNFVVPAKAGTHEALKKLDSGFRRNDVAVVMQRSLSISPFHQPIYSTASFVTNARTATIVPGIRHAAACRCPPPPWRWRTWQYVHTRLLSAG